MKKSYHRKVMWREFFTKKTIRIMKMYVIIAFMTLGELMATDVFTQNISLNIQDQPLSQAIAEIEQITDYHVFYNSKLVDLSQKITVQIRDASLEEALDHLFANKEIDYLLVKNLIVLFKKGDPDAEKWIKTIVEENPLPEKSVTTNRVVSPLKKENITLRPSRPALSGIVTDESGEPLIGVNILVKGTNRGTSTDFEGRFTLDEVDDQAILVVSYIGYQTQEIKVGGRTEIEIVLVEDSQTLDEVVVVGYGTQKKVNVTGSISTLNQDDLSNRPITNTSQALQGVQGLYVNQASGQPGADGTTIRIRGLSSIGGAGKLEPLVLVDGVEFPLRAINPNDIENISVLKDAASTAIYGSRAANGVVLITTKKGSKENVEVNYSGYYGIQEATYLPDPVDNSADFMELYNQAQVNQGSAPLYPDELINEFRSNPTSQLHPNTNWMDLLFGTAPIHEHNLRVSGGGEKIQFNLSAGFMDQQGVLKEMSAAKRYTLNLRINSQLSDRLSVEGGVMGTRWGIEEPTRGMSTAMNRIMRMVPVQPIGQLENGTWPNSRVVTPGQNSFQNPLILRDETYRNQTINRFLVNLSASYKISDGLRYQIRGSINTRDYLMDDWLPLILLHNVTTGEPERPFWSGVSQKTNRQEDDQQLTLFNTLNYQQQISDNHNFNILLGSSIEKFNSSYFQARIEGFPTNDLPELNIGTSNPNVAGTSSTDVLISYFGRIQYSYLDKYLFEVNSRYDGSSRFAKQNRWGFFPSLSAGWRISEEPFLQNVNGLNELKIRASWGQIGNQEIGRFQYINSVNLGYGYPFGGDYSGGSAVTQYRDPGLQWETTTVTNMGLDWVLFNGSFSGVLEVFKKHTDGILRGITLPAQVGDLAGPVTNLAEVDNIGFEIGLNYKNQIGSSDFSYEVGLHLSRVRNEVVDLNGEEIFSGSRITKEGYPIGSWYVLKTDGLFQTQEEADQYPTISNRVGPGDIKYVDLNNDGIINGDDRYIAGNTFPDLTYGFNIGFQYRDISLSTMWQGVENIHVRPNYNLASPFNNGAGLTKDWLTDSWTPENTDATLPRISARNQYTLENFSNSDFWLEDASYLRLKNIQLSYRFADNLLSRIGATQTEVFINGQNILTFSEVTKFDPERNITAENITQFPSVKTFTMGVNITF